MNKLIEIKQLSKIYGSGDSRTIGLDNISLEIMEGELIGIIGPSGSGKSTLLKILGTLDYPTAGEYLYKGENIENLKGNSLAKFRNKEIGFIVQDYSLIEYETVYKNVEIPLKYGKVKNRKEKIKKILDELGIVEKEKELVKNAELILADEPTGALDSENGKQILNILKEINKQGKTVLIVTHDNEIANQCNRIIKLKDGKITCH